jgi:hypothetical protein
MWGVIVGAAKTLGWRLLESSATTAATGILQRAAGWLTGHARLALAAVAALVVAALAIAAWWHYTGLQQDLAAARTQAEQQSQRAERAASAARANAEAAEAARMERELLDDLITDRQQRERRLRRELAQTQDRLQEAMADADQKTRRCLQRRLPDDLAGELRRTEAQAEAAPAGDQAGEGDAAD